MKGYGIKESALCQKMAEMDGHISDQFVGFEGALSQRRGLHIPLKRISLDRFLSRKAVK